MSKPLQNPPPGFDDLSVGEKIDYLQSLWDRVSVDAEKVPVPDWHLKIIRDRAAELEANPESTIPWDQARKDIVRRLSEK